MSSTRWHRFKVREGKFKGLWDIYFARVRSASGILRGIRRMSRQGINRSRPCAGRWGLAGIASWWALTLWARVYVPVLFVCWYDLEKLHTTVYSGWFLRKLQECLYTLKIFPFNLLTQRTILAHYQNTLNKFQPKVSAEKHWFIYSQCFRKTCFKKFLENISGEHGEMTFQVRILLQLSWFS